MNMRKIALDSSGLFDVGEEEEPAPPASPMVSAYPARSVRYPYVEENPVTVPNLSLKDIQGSVVIPSSMFKLETAETPLDDYVMPLDDAIDENTYVGDWEELFIRRYASVFAQQEHQLYCARCDIGLIVTAVAKAVDGNYPTLSLGPNGYHYAPLPLSSHDHEFPAPKHLLKLFPHFEECKFAYVKDGDKLSAELLSFEQKMKPVRYKFGLLYVKVRDCCCSYLPIPTFSFCCCIGQSKGRERLLLQFGSEHWICRFL